MTRVLSLCHNLRCCTLGILLPTEKDPGTLRTRLSHKPPEIGTWLVTVAISLPLWVERINIHVRGCPSLFVRQESAFQLIPWNDLVQDIVQRRSSTLLSLRVRTYTIRRKPLIWIDDAESFAGQALQKLSRLPCKLCARFVERPCRLKDQCAAPTCVIALAPPKLREHTP